MNTNMPVLRNNSLKSKVVLGFVLVFSALGVASYISYQSFEELTQAVNTLSSPDSTLKQVDHMLVTITQTENALQEYTISKSSKKLELYYDHVNQIKENASQLKDNSYNAEGQIDSILNLIDAKLVSMSSFITISKQRDEFDFYNKALKELEEGQRQVVVNDSIHFLEETRRRRSMLSLERFRSFLNRRTAPSAQEVAELPADSVKKILRQVRNQQNARQQKIDQRELAYLETNAQVMGSIHAVLDKLKQAQQTNYQARSEAAKASIEDALVRIGFILLIALFSTVLIVYLILADITRSDFYKRRLMVAKSSAEKLARVKEDFLANMSHEIRTPLTAILGFAEQLRYTSLDHRQQDYLQALDASSQHLLALVNDVLDFSKIEAGGLTLERVPFHLIEAVEEVQYALHPQAEKKGLSLQIQADEEAWDHVEGDAFRLKQVLYNLISNAIKFTHEGGILIVVQINPFSDEEVRVTLEVRDTGIGIAPDKIDSVFKVFSQSDASTTRKYGGTGLGLSICKKLVELQGGIIEVESTVDQGSTFRVTMPYLLTAEPDTTPEDQPLVPSNPQYQGNALVIDDQPLNSQLLALALKNQGIQTQSAVSGREGLALLGQHTFDIIFCDLHMPEMDGKQVIRAIVRDLEAQDSDTPIIAFTANVLPQERAQYEALGVKDFLYKPFSHADLNRLLITYLPHADLEKVSAPSVASVPGAQYTLSGVKQFTGEDDSLLAEYLDNLSRSYQASVAELRRASSEGNVDGISFYAHKMVSQAELLQHRSLTKVLKQLELIESNSPVHDDITEQVDRVTSLIEQLIASIQLEVEQLSQKVA